MNNKFSHRLCTQPLELNISMKRKCLGWRLISKEGYNFVQEDVWFEGDRIRYGLRMNFHINQFPRRLYTVAGQSPSGQLPPG